MVNYYYGNQGFNSGDNVGYGEAYDYGAAPPPLLIGALVNTADTLSGWEGHDVIFGDCFNPAFAGAADTIIGGEGDDWLFGDTVDFDYGPLLLAFPFLVFHLDITLADGTTLTITDDAQWKSRATAGGNDKLYGGTGNDHLFGGAGHDVLDGGAGVDFMEGGYGNDRYYVDHVSDIVVEVSGTGAGLGGTDTVTSATLKLDLRSLGGGNVENATLTGTGALSVVGSNIATVANTLTGNAGANVIAGLAGQDFIAGGQGQDTLNGGVGKDYFIFNTALNAATNLDHIRDFNLVDDTIRLENSIFTKLSTTGALSPLNFLPVGSRTPDSNDYIVYDKATGTLYYDVGGSTTPTLGIAFAVFDNKPTLTNSDFVII